MNWTSTQVPLWQVDCSEFCRVGRPFEVRDVNLPEHDHFIELFATRHDLKFVRNGSTVVLERCADSEFPGERAKKETSDLRSVAC